MTVRRTLPQARRSLIGAWCFADHYGPDDVSESGGMDVPPHPHAGLQTVSWLFSGEIEHRDSQGVHAVVRPGELNVMTGGHGICHSEVSTPDTRTVHGVQLWVALPDQARDAPRQFQHYAPAAVPVTDAGVRVFLGSCAGQVSPVHTFTALLGAEILLPPGSCLTLPVDRGFEHGVLAGTGDVELFGTRLPHGALGYAGMGLHQLTLANPGDAGVRAILLGGAPFAEQILMWWNFVGRSHEEIAAYRQEWEDGSGRFGHVHGYQGHAIDRLPAPALPTVRLVPRRNPPPIRP